MKKEEPTESVDRNGQNEVYRTSTNWPNVAKVYGAETAIRAQADGGYIKPCPNCYGGHFRPCQWCGDSGEVLFIPDK